MDEQTHKQLVEAVRNYRMPQSAIDLLTVHLPLVLAGVTAAGKDAVAEYIEQNSNWRRIVTHTTRPLRPGDRNGINQWFVSEAEMLALIKANAFIEAKMVHYPQCKGSSIAAYQKVIEGGYKPIMRIDIQGIKEIMKNTANLRPIFILPPSFEVWMERLDRRGHMSHVERVKRLQSAKEELEMATLNERFILVVNDEVPRVAREIIDGVSDVASQHRNRELTQRLIDHIRAY